MGMLDRVLDYVRAVLAGEKKGDAAVGRYLMDTLGASTHDLEKSGFNTYLQVKCFVLKFFHLMLNLYETGYINDVLPLQLSAFSGRSILSPSPCCGLMNALMINAIYCCTI